MFNKTTIRKDQPGICTYIKRAGLSSVVQCLIYAMTAGAFAIFFGGNLLDGFSAMFVGALIRITLYAFTVIKMKAIFF